MSNTLQFHENLPEQFVILYSLGDSLENNGNSNSLCLEGLQSMLGKTIESFYCEPPVSGQYVNLNQKITDKHLALTEIAVYSDFERKLSNEHS